MATYQRGKYWWYRFRIAGERIDEPTKSTSRTVAKEAERQHRRTLEAGYNNFKEVRQNRVPLILQEHDAPVRYRNFWVRPLPPEPESLPATFVVALRASEADLRDFVGDYAMGPTTLKVAAAEHGLDARMSVDLHGVHYDLSWPLHLIDRDSFLGIAPDGGLPLHLGFVRDAKGSVTTAVTHMAESYGSFARRP